MIDTTAFIASLRETGGYRTPDRVQRPLVDRAMGRTSLWYYRQVFGVVLRGGRMARQGQWNRESWQDLSLDMWRGVERCGGRMQVDGCGHLAGLTSPAVIVANHMSLLETFSIPAVVLPFQHMTFVVKESLLQLPVFRYVMQGVQPISVGRLNPRDDFKVLMEKGPEVLAHGRSVVIFPQASRHPVFKPAEFNSIGVKLARAAGVPLVPLALKTDFHGIGRWVRDFGPVNRDKTVCFRFGAPLDVAGNGREAHAACMDFIARTVTQWGGIVDRESS